MLPVRAPPVTLLPEARYDEVMTAFGGRGFLVRTVEELRSALQISLDDWERPSLLNVLIDPSSDRKQQVYIYVCVCVCVCVKSSQSSRCNFHFVVLDSLLLVILLWSTLLLNVCLWYMIMSFVAVIFVWELPQTQRISEVQVKLKEYTGVYLKVFLSYYNS